ncbi:DUF3182 family protein [Hoeflea sp. YIM 152468]|uniref:DUF3182 family protein n=1 Tax=Hoeflea sp. YIM 152468 TaxID=3031759 RepID=UPI0023DB6860|nr:DUF3182 family protein [Hoeflea sp. YIM 152468]MDF1609375.1 DUF3182 family protein [Hoeflea sp. YIM 152468]
MEQASPLARHRDDGPVLTWGCLGLDSHDELSHIALTRRVADFLGKEYHGRLEDYRCSRRPYCVPRATLCGAECSPHLPYPGEGDFLGGQVSHPMAATKAIVHPLAPDEALDPTWPGSFARVAADLTLPGFTATTSRGAIAAGRKLLQAGDIRIKLVSASGGTQQQVATSLDELFYVIDTLTGDDGLFDCLVLEENLTDVRTFSVGQIMLGGVSAAYMGEQQLTLNNQRQEVYGGSCLQVSRGRLSDLVEALSGEERNLCELGMRFDHLATRHLGLVASRRNYDLISGRDSRGRIKHAVLEQSWRVGGASGAEIAALKAFAHDPDLHKVQASTVEQYGDDIVPPRDADVYFHGVDPELGPLLKYSHVQDAR